MSNETSIREQIESRLQAGLSLIALDVIDESHKHAGHLGADQPPETHFHVRIVSADFRSLSRLDRQRLVYSLLDDLLKTKIHALSLSLSDT
ncbi:MAG: BolA family transcriptional regulator [Alphaproteobacteria bacterium]|nr:BolA family transcriptional regulator [Alphaproteobacteria bacterium]